MQIAEYVISYTLKNKSLTERPARLFFAIFFGEFGT